MTSLTLTHDIGSQHATEGPLKTYEKAIYIAFGSIRIKVTEESSDVPKLQVVLQTALIDFVKDLGRNSEKAKSCTIDINEVRQLMNREILDDEGARLAFLQRAEEVLKNTEDVFCDGIRKGVEDFQDKLINFQESNIKEEKITIKQKAAELENQKRLGSVTADAQAVGDAIAIAVPAEQYSGIVSLLVRLGLTVGKNKLQDEADQRMIELEEAQQDCNRVMLSVDSFDVAAKSAWSSLGDCTSFPLEVQRFIRQLHRSLLGLHGRVVAPSSVDILQHQWLQLLSLVNGYQATVSDIMEVAPLFEERSMTDEVEAFGERIAGLHNTFNQLCTAEDIIEDANRTLLLTKIHELSGCIVKQLGKIQEVFIRWHVYSNSESVDTFYFIPEILDMTRNIGSFDWSVQPLYVRIKSVLRDGFHRKKARRAQEKREREQNIGVSQIRGFRSVVSEAEGLAVLERVDVILKGITEFSTEFGAALLYFDGRRGGGAGRAAAVGSAPQSSRYPKNPFKVPREVTEQVMGVLRSETSKLSQLSVPKN